MGVAEAEAFTRELLELLEAHGGKGAERLREIFEGGRLHEFTVSVDLVAGTVGVSSFMGLAP